MGAIRAWWHRYRAGRGQSHPAARAGTAAVDAPEPPVAAEAPRDAAPAGDRGEPQASFDQLLRHAADRRGPSGEEQPSA
jgi:hypothetical protein